MNDAGKVVIAIVCIGLVILSVNFILSEEEKIEKYPASVEIDKKTNLGKYIISDEFWEDMSISEGIRSEVNSSQIRIFGADNVTAMAILDWYRLINFNNDWILIET